MPHNLFWRVGKGLAMVVGSRKFWFECGLALHHAGCKGFLWDTGGQRILYGTVYAVEQMAKSMRVRDVTERMLRLSGSQFRRGGDTWVNREG